jgi:hypothetical protein
MSARTYSNDVYLTSPALTVKASEVRIMLREFRSLSVLPSPACEQSCTSSCQGRENRKSAKPSSPNPWATPSQGLGCQ